ncbi:MAG: hypothetical protein JWN94_2682, partial [Betaproteobacteria bacterium]|nr:hypothetical protein [Betaproteobacteria bacterium]
MTLRHATIAAFSLAGLVALSPFAQAADSPLDYNFFKASVEPIFLKKRPEHVRCYVCHSESNNAFKLQHLAHGAKAYTDEQSRKNFASATSLVVPGDIAKSRLLLQPLDPKDGGNPYHSGGRQFESKNDP